MLLCEVVSRLLVLAGFKEGGRGLVLLFRR
jgi:hypothetical protein